MQEKKLWPLALIGLGLFLAAGPRIEIPDNLFNIPFSSSTVTLKDRALLLVYEQQSQSPEVTLAMREKDAFLEKNEMSQFLAIDVDDAFAKPAIEAAAEKGIKPPFLALATKDGGSYKIHRIKAFVKDFEDIK